MVYYTHQSQEEETTLYYICDLYAGKALSFQSRETLAAFWFKKFGRRFEDLNVTGKDTRVEYVSRPRPSALVPDKLVTVSAPELVTRRYQVLDEKGRSVDIRTWPEEIFREPKPAHAGYSLSGAKQYRGHWHGPTLQLRSMREFDVDDHMDDVEHVAVRDRSRLRRKAVLSPGDYEDHVCCVSARSKSCSWKDQTRARKQYARHKDNVTYRVPKGSVSDLEPRAAQYDIPDYMAAYLDAVEKTA